MKGAWTMTEDGEFVLNEPYATVLREARVEAMHSWCETICEYVAERSQYTAEFLLEELTRLTTERDESPDEIVAEFVVKALEGEF